VAITNGAGAAAAESVSEARKVYALHYGSAERALATVVPDSQWPGMWRIAWPDGRLSDMVNLSRAKDAAESIVERGPPARNRKALRWCVEDARTAPLVRLNGADHAEYTPSDLDDEKTGAA
jgi:hypothetical protein